jgi:SAM-dependent methyltransferase
MLKMNSLLGKQILSLIRDGNYAHAGEEEAILRALDSIPKDANRLILDIGCGIGGTAAFIQEHGWGKVTGIDVDKEILKHAKQLYPNVIFYNCDVLDISQTVTCKANLICLFNAFYSFEHQDKALMEMRKVAKDDAELIIFDYVHRGDYQDAGSAENGTPILPHPIEFDSITNMLSAAGWSLTKVEDLDNDYERWYNCLVKKINDKRSEIIEISGPQGFTYVQEHYAQLLNEIKRGALGGAIVRAQCK